MKLSQLPECLVCEVLIQNKRGFLVALYGSPIQSQNCFQMLLHEFEKLLAITWI